MLEEEERERKLGGKSNRKRFANQRSPSSREGGSWGERGDAGGAVSEKGGVSKYKVRTSGRGGKGGFVMGRVNGT